MIRKKITVAVFLIINIVFLTGCWGMREINELGLVMAVGIDKEPKDDVYTITVQIAKPSASSSGGEGKVSQTWIVTAKGKTVFDAIRALSTVSSRRIMWAHNNIIIIGEAAAKDSIIPIIDFFTHNPEVRMRTYVAVAHGDAKQYLTSETGLDEISGLGFREMYRYQPLTAQSVKSSMLTLSREYFSEDMQPVITGISFKKYVLKPNEKSSPNEEKVSSLSGVAVFKNDKMLGWLSPEEARGLAWLRNEAKSTVITVMVPGNENKSISVEVDKIKAKIETAVNDGIPSVTIKLSGDVDIVEEDIATNLSIDELKRLVEKLVEDQIAADIRLMLGKVQKEYNSDVVGFGATMRAQHYKEWVEIRNQWQSIFPGIPVNILVDIKAKTSTTLQQPMHDIRKAGDE